MSGIRPPDCSKLAKNPKNDNDVTIFRHDVNVKFFWRCFVSLVKFSYWSKFHVNIITGSGVMTIFFYKGLTGNPESEIPSSEFCPISGDWGELGIPNLARMSLIKCYWMLQNSRVTAFTVLELLRENQLGGGKITPPPHPTQIRVNRNPVVSIGIPIFESILTFLQLSFNTILKVSPDRKPWLHFFKMFREVKFVKTNATNT